MNPDNPNKEEKEVDPYFDRLNSGYGSMFDENAESMTVNVSIQEDGIPGFEQTQSTSNMAIPPLNPDTFVCMEDQSKYYFSRTQIEVPKEYFHLIKKTRIGDQDEFHLIPQTAEQNENLLKINPTKYMNGTREGDYGFWVVLPKRYRCRHLKMQLIDVEGNPDYTKTEKLCATRRSVTGAFFDIGENPIFACDLRDPYDVSTSDLITKSLKLKVEKGKQRRDYALPKFILEKSLDLIKSQFEQVGISIAQIKSAQEKLKIDAERYNKHKNTTTPDQLIQVVSNYQWQSMNYIAKTVMDVILSSHMQIISTMALIVQELDTTQDELEATHSTYQQACGDISEDILQLKSLIEQIGGDYDSKRDLVDQANSQIDEISSQLANISEIFEQNEDEQEEEYEQEDEDDDQEDEDDDQADSKVN